MHEDFWMVATAVLVPIVLVASYVDYAERKVPNVLNVSLLLLGLAAQMIWHGMAGLGSGLLGVVAGFVPLFLVWLIGGMGAGDVKLMAAIGAWLGWMLTLWAFAIGALLGGVIAVIMIVAGKKVDYALVNLRTIASKFTQVSTALGEFGSVESFGGTTQKLPYGVPLTLGTLAVLIWESKVVTMTAPWQ